MTEQKATFPPASTMKAAVDDIRMTWDAGANLAKAIATMHMTDDECGFALDTMVALAWVGSNRARSNEISCEDMVAIIKGDLEEPQKSGYLECCVTSHEIAVASASVLYSKCIDAGVTERWLQPRNEIAASAMLVAGAILLQASKDIAQYWNVTAEEMADHLRANGRDVVAKSILERPYDIVTKD